MPDPVDVLEGDLAFAWNVQQLADILLGKRATQVRLTRWSHATEPTLKLANRNAGGPILELFDHLLTTSVMKVDETGIRATKVNGYFDFQFQAVAPAAPLDASTIRFYSRAGQFYFKTMGSSEQQIPIGAPPGPTMRYGFWMA